MNRHNIIIIGSPQSGKTNYLSASLLYFSVFAGERNSNCITVTAANREMAEHLADTSHQFRQGKWHDKTYVFSDFWLDVSYPLVNFFCFKELSKTRKKFNFKDYPGEDFINEDKQVLADFKNCKGILFAVDGEKMADTEYMHYMSTVAISLSDALKHHRKSGIKVAFVITKSDTLPDTYLADNGRHAKQELMDNFANLINTIKDEKYMEEPRRSADAIFLVSCVPNKTCRETKSIEGIVPSGSWNPEVMKNEVEPFIWLFKNVD